ncbi:MAG: hypothetical protein M3Y87_03225 [Myxococcota bacterium]|nr:hypothetical protein [Myxococcota bacterium]
MRARVRHLAIAFLSSAASLALVGCGEPPPIDPTPDASQDDAGVDAGPPLTCTSTMTLEARMGETVSAMFDTTMTETRPRDLGLTCGNPAAELRWAPQEVVELLVPGSGPVAVAFDTAVSGTDEGFNTVIQVRRTCEAVPEGIFPPTCFDDVSRSEYRARGVVQAMGGDTLFFVVTGYTDPPAMTGTVDRGRVQVDFTVGANTAPTASSGYLRLANADVLVGATGMDAERNAAGVAMNFLGPDGALLDIYGDGEATMDGDVFWVFFDPPPTTADFTGRTTVLATQVNLGGYLRAVNASAALFRVFDTAWASSAPLEVAIEEATLVGLGEACDVENVCRLPMTCSATTMTCEVTGAARAVCESGTVVTIEAPTDVATSTMLAGNTGAGMGQYEASCAAGMPTIGAERVYIVPVPEGTFDLQVTTDLPGTGMVDTIVYVRTLCPDSGTELACNDDLAAANLQSAVEVRDLEAGVVYVIVERKGGLASGTIPHEIRFTLRPVRASGETCDVAGVTSRCAAGSTCAGDPAVCS